ncbi:MAG TPA: energy transducer TonB [Gemmatimonadaceae bacterium]|nr:energy transducer TonB [Gemmatimonadaceae bacterium]
MLDRLLESGARRNKSAWGGAVSVAVHSTIIVLAVAATATGEPGPTFTRDTTRVIFIDPPPSGIPSGPVRRPRMGSTGTRTTVPQLPDVDTPMPTFDPTLPGTAPARGGGTADTALLSEIGGGGSGPGVAAGGSGVATDATVDVPLRALTDRAPAYPEALRAAGISGRVRVRFVVDTTGRAELASVRVIESSHELFARAVIASLRQARFTPGEVSGHRVRTLVERSYRFDIAAGAR